jgi:hypothetical protein
VCAREICGMAAGGFTFGSFFQYLEKTPDRAAVFHAGIGNRGRIAAQAIIDAYDFSTSRLVVDVGGGNGAFLSAILTTHNNVSGVLVDRTAAIGAAKSGRGGPLPRCEFVDHDILSLFRWRFIRSSGFFSISPIQTQPAFSIIAEKQCATRRAFSSLKC